MLRIGLFATNPIVKYKFKEIGMQDYESAQMPTINCFWIEERNDNSGKYNLVCTFDKYEWQF